MQPDNIPDIRTAYDDHASSIAGDACCGAGSCGSCDSPPVTSAPAFKADSLTSYGLSCGDSVAAAMLQPGETVLDIGSGAGRDVFSAGRIVGSTGKVLGVDQSREMLKLAREHELRYREDSSLHNTEFREGQAEDLPLFDESVDVVISNCVVNLCSDRPQVLREAFRVLRPGGRLVLSDLVIVDDPRKASLSGRTDASAVYAGALSCQDYIACVEAAGFEGLQVLGLRRYADGQACGDPVTSGIQDLLVELAASLTLLAVKPA